MRKLFISRKFQIFLLLVIASFFSVYWIFSNSKKGTEIFPTPIPRVFALEKVIPPNGINTTIVPTSAIEFDFNKQINPDTLIVKIDPISSMKLEISDNQRSIFVRAVPTWDLNKEYTISIEVKSSEGEVLPNKIVYPLKIIRQTNSNLIEKFQ